MPLSNSTRDKLKTVSTATLCSTLFKRGLRNQFIQNVLPLNSSLPNMVGEAFTLRYIPAREDLNPMTVFQDPKHPQRVAIEECPPGAVMVIDSRKDARAASAGSILITRLMVRGAAGAVTDGGAEVRCHGLRGSLATGGLEAHDEVAPFECSAQAGCGEQ